MIAFVNHFAVSDFATPFDKDRGVINDQDRNEAIWKHRRSVARIDPLASATHRGGPGYWDFLPGNTDGSCTCFIICDKQRQRWVYDTPDAKRRPQVSKEEWSKLDTWKVEWAEPFYTHLRESYFFVTTSGKVYVGKPGKPNEDAKAEELKIGGKPILALLFDSEKDRAFVFGKDFFLELKDGTKKRPCETITPLEGEADSPLQTLIKCAHAVKKHDASR